MSTLLSVKEILDTWLSYIDGSLMLQRPVLKLIHSAATSSK
jgi:hypothetical protein